MITHPNRNKRRPALSSAPLRSRPKAKAKVRATHDRDYAALQAALTGQFRAATAAPGEPLFMTNTTGLYEAYLNNLPSEREHHTCSACRRFIETYGGLVVIKENGFTHSAMWEPRTVPEFYHHSIARMREIVARAQITGPFLSKQMIWGQPVTGAWEHLSIVGAPIYPEGALTAGQAMADARERFGMVERALQEFTATMLDQAIRILEADAVSRAEKFIGPVTWLRKLHDRPAGFRGMNVLWRAIATAPIGYCHPRTSVIAPLLADIEAQLPFATIQKKFNAMLHPLKYQRPQAAPTAGNIEAAERLIEKLGLAPALERRFARLEDVLPHAIWEPWVTLTEARNNTLRRVGGKVFGHLAPKDRAPPPIDLPTRIMTWIKFRDTVIDDANTIELAVPVLRGPFIGMTTAVHPDAPPILKWDYEDERNPVCWYVYPNGSHAAQWSLCPGLYTRVNAIVPFPTMWGVRPAPELFNGAIFILEGARDISNHSLALFPETLRGDLHGARATIEAHSRSGRLADAAIASACGYEIRPGGQFGADLRVFSQGAWVGYRIDRWD